MWKLITVNVSQNNKKLSVKLNCTTFKASCNNYNSDSQQCCID